jgi:hypothetical protein
MMPDDAIAVSVDADDQIYLEGDLDAMHLTFLTGTRFGFITPLPDEIAAALAGALAKALSRRDPQEHRA